ncbi:DUF6611 family protein [Mycolicibacterium sp. 050158]|uniref:DUF6611 family protein n=1 Tax=Mycolicibacterium sp. 050158 TaxID=3090602 RepID=UPI00299D7F7C|nr:DUF6611 family protein [Mycolicibacterium sp. 050158]MDX1890391.1 DUF6611 family protein [Mycolicibacterium sp. 050158]
MTDSTHPPRWRRLLDGGTTWGSLAVSPTRYGVTRFRLVVYPPGISADDRILLRAWRGWPVWGITVFLVLEVMLVPVLGPTSALTVAAVAFLGSGAALAAMTGATRGGVRTLSAIRMAGAEGTAMADGFAELRLLTNELAKADAALAAGEIDAVAHELLVWRVYDRMGADPLAHARSHVRPD